MIRSLLYLVAIFFVAFTAQIELPIFLHPGFELLNIPLIALCHLSLRKGALSGLFIGLFVGLTADILGSGLVGVYAFSYATIGFLVGELGYRFFLTKPYLEGVVVGGAVMLNLLLVKFLSLIFSFATPHFFSYFLLFRFLLNGLFALFLLFVLELYRRGKG